MSEMIHVLLNIVLVVWLWKCYSQKMELERELIERTTELYKLKCIKPGDPANVR